MTTETTPKTTSKKQTVKSSTEKIFGADVMRHGYTALPNILVRGQQRLGLNPTQFNILAHLLSYWYDPAKPPFPPKRELVRRLGITDQTLRKQMKALEDRGYVRREQQYTAAGDFGSNIYHLDGLISQLVKLVPDFDEEKAEREESRRKSETPRARQTARRAAQSKQ